MRTGLCGRLTAGALAATFGSGICHAAEPARIELLLRPHATDGKVDWVDVRMTLEHPDVAAGATLVRLPLVVASIPTQRYDGDALQARDATGDLPLVQDDAAPQAMLTNRDWRPGRATRGDVVLTYRAKPRAVTASTRNGPLFDLREEAGGLDGAGYTFAPAPVDDRPRRLHVHWDLSAMPAGARGVWSLGEGDADAVKPAETLQTSYYFAGPVKSYPAEPDGRFAMYWLTAPPFDAPEAGKMIRRLFDYTSTFFHDEGGSYRVFIRKQPYKGDGGTALARSFMVGWGTGKIPTLEGLEGLIAHEMVHNWPTMDGDHADTSWYTEGTAEYYSILLSYRAGLITPAEFLERINERALAYYRNSLQSLSNREAEEIYWKDSRAQRVPYGRGFMYLAEVDAEIRARSHGKRSLDNVVLALMDARKRHETTTTVQWEDLVAAELGPRARQAYADMVAGKLIAPPQTAFAPCFHPVPIQVHPFDFGFAAAAVKGPGSKITGVVPGSAAAKAGLRDGDEVVRSPDLGAPALMTSDDPITLVVRRAERELTVTFLPRSEPVRAWQWARDPEVADAACKL